MNTTLRPLALLVPALLLAACGQPQDPQNDQRSDQQSEAPAAATAPDTDPAAASVASAGDTGVWQHPVTPWGDPDLQGMWPVYHLITTPMQRPEQYGERLYFTEDELAAQEERVEERNARYEEENSSDRIGMGHWAEESDVPPQTSLITDPPDGRFPAMTDQGKEMSARLGSSWGREDFDTYLDFDGWDRCISRGMPSSMFPYQYNNGIQIIQTPGYVVVNLEMIHEARIIPVDGRPPLDSNIKQWMGESRGRWEGNTLIVETTNFNGKLSMTNAGITGHPPGEHASSTEMHIVERFERVSENRLNYSVTVEDPITLTAPWTAAFPWRLDPDYEYFEYACHEDNYAIRDFITTSRFRRAQEAEAAE